MLTVYFKLRPSFRAPGLSELGSDSIWGIDKCKTLPAWPTLKTTFWSKIKKQQTKEKNIKAIKSEVTQKKVEMI